MSLALFTERWFAGCRVAPVRQTVSNWETGANLPSLELLLDVQINSAEDSWQSILATDLLACLFPHLGFHPRSFQAQQLLGRDQWGMGISTEMEKAP